MSHSGKDIFSGKTRLRACALIFRNRELLLVQQHVPTRDKPVWLPPGGGIEFGETAQKAVVREVAEETGLAVRPLRLAAVHEFVESPHHAVELYFYSEITGGTLKTGTDPELSSNNQQIIRCEFVEVEKLPSMPVFPLFIQQTDLERMMQGSEIPHYKTDR